MSPHALVIDDDPVILGDVRDRLESLGHSCDGADCQEAAQKCLKRRAYGYILLDMEIPVKYGRPARIQNGKNLLREIRAMKERQDVQIIVMTAHGRDGPELATEVLRGREERADDFVNKPFPVRGHTIEKAIMDALSRAGKAAEAPKGETQTHPAVRLGPPGEPCLVLGKQKKPLTEGQQAVISAILEAGDEGMKKDRLERVRSSARRMLNDLRKDEDWAKVILMPKQTNGRYRLKM
jgi:DNA-binding response OmpR family regulator